MPINQTLTSEKENQLKDRRYRCGCKGGLTVVWEPELKAFICTECGHIDRHRTCTAKYGKCLIHE